MIMAPDIQVKTGYTFFIETSRIKFTAFFFLNPAIRNTLMDDSTQLNSTQLNYQPPSL